MVASLPRSVVLRPAVYDDVALLGPIDAATEAQFVDVGHPEFAGGGTITDHEACKAIDRGHLWIAEVDQQVCGWLVLTRTGDELCVGQVAVLPSAQGRGVGTQLMAVAIEAARSAGDSTIVLSTQSDVAWNQPWYESLGFVVVPEAEWTTAMRSETKAQIEAGLDWSTRVHMRVEIG